MICKSLHSVFIHILQCLNLFGNGVLCIQNTRHYMLSKALITKVKATILLQDSCAPHVIPHYHWRYVWTLWYRKRLYLPLRVNWSIQSEITIPLHSPFIFSSSFLISQMDLASRFISIIVHHNRDSEMRRKRLVPVLCMVHIPFTDTIKNEFMSVWKTHLHSKTKHILD